MIFGVSCVQNPTGTSEPDGVGAGALATDAEPTGEAVQAAYENTFHFVVTVEDDGKDAAGGWQTAVKTLSFIETDDESLIPYYFKCPVEIGMPIRSSTRGTISAQHAAAASAAATTEATESLMHSRNWRGEGAAYCRELYRRIQILLQSPPHSIGGAKVKRP